SRRGLWSHSRPGAATRAAANGRSRCRQRATRAARIRAASPPGCGLHLHARCPWLVTVVPSHPGGHAVTQGGKEPDRIDLDDPGALAGWARKLDASEEQLRDAVGQVGSKAADVEMHLKGARSTTNSDRVREAGG